RFTDMLLNFRLTHRLAAGALGLFALAGCPVLFATVSFAQQLDRIQRQQASDMLSNIKNEIQKNYYDPTFHGINIDDRFKAANEKLKQAQTLGSAFGIIAQTLVDFNDSHLFFLPPQRTSRVEYGWKMSMIGDTPFVTAVKPGS